MSFSAAILCDGRAIAMCYIEFTTLSRNCVHVHRALKDVSIALFATCFLPSLSLVF